MTGYCPFKQFSNIFGKPNTGFHSVRFLGTALGDYILTILLAIIITWITKIPLVITTIICLVVGVILHMLFGVNTGAVKFLGLSC
jgi:hypothetical protein